jgi:ABC-2 type transport system ATP-binding protein
MLSFQQVKKSYGDQLVIDVPSLTLDKGIYWLKGHNGSGKTTLLKMIAGLIPFRGDFLYESLSLKQDPVAFRRKIGWSEAEPLFPEFITGEELIRLYAGVRKAEQQQISDLLSLFRMNAYVQNAVRTYSSGMQKKLAIVLALIGDPSLILLDEPLITLDAESSEKLIVLVNEWYVERGINFLLSSHVEPDPAMTRGHRLLKVDHHTVVAAA